MMLSPQTQGKLAGLRSKAKLLFFIEGLSIAMLMLCGAILVTMGLDFLLRGPALFRLVLNLIALGLISYCVYRFLVYPLMVQMSEDDMALCVEKGYPGLKDSLISSLQLGRKYDPSDTFNSSAMVRALVAQTEQVTGKMNFKRVVGFSGSTKGFFAGAILALLIVSGGFMAVDQMWDMFVKRIILLTDEKYPEPWSVKDVNKRKDGILYVPSHSEVMLEINVTRKDNDDTKEISALHVDYWTKEKENDRRKLKTVECVKDETQKNHFYVKIPRVKNDVDYLIRGYKMQDFKGKIKVVPRPEILEIKCVVGPPIYTKRFAHDAAVEDLNALRGSEVAVGIYTSCSVSEAYIVFTKGRETMKKVDLRPWPDPDNHTRLRGTFFAEETTTFKIVVQDEQFADDKRFTNLDPMEYCLTVYTDEAPSILMTSPSRLNLKKTKDATVRIRAEADDDVWIRRVELLYQTFGAGAGSGGVQPNDVKTLELYDFQKDRWTGPGEETDFSYERKRDIEHPWSIDSLKLANMGRVSLKLRITDGFDLRHLNTAQDYLERLALNIYNGHISLEDFWKRLDLPEDVRKRLMVMTYAGLIRSRKMERSWKHIDNILMKRANDYFAYAGNVNLEVSEDATEKEKDKVKRLEKLHARFMMLAEPLRERCIEIHDKLFKSEEVDMESYIMLLKEATLSGKREFRDLRSLEELEQRALDAPPQDELEAFLLYAKIYLKIEEAIAKELRHIDILNKHDKLQIEILRDLIRELEEKKPDTNDLVDLLEIDAKIAKAYHDITALEVKLKRKEPGELKGYEEKFLEAALAFKNKVAEQRIFVEREASWDRINDILMKRANDYFAYAGNVNLRVSEDATEKEKEKVKRLEKLHARFMMLAEPLRERRGEIHDKLFGSEEVDMKSYIMLLKEATLSGKREFRDLRSLEELEQRALDAPPQDELEAFLLYAKIYLKIEEAIARELRHIDILQWRTSELVNPNQNFKETWERLGEYDSLDFSELGVAVRSNRRDAENLLVNIEDKKATLSGEISELMQAIMKYCEKNGIPVESQGFIPRPKDAPPAGTGNGGGSVSLQDFPTSHFIQDDAEDGEGAEAGDDGDDADAAEDQDPPQEEDAEGIQDEASLLEARFLGWEKKRELENLEGADARYEIFRNIEDALDEAGKWVGPNFYETDVIHLSIVDRLAKKEDIVDTLIELGKKIEALRDKELNDAMGALGRYTDLCKATAEYGEGGTAASEVKLLKAVGNVYPRDKQKFVGKFLDKEKKVINTKLLLEAIDRFKIDELAAAWAAQKTIAEELPGITKTAIGLKEEYIDNGFGRDEIIRDLTRKTSDIEGGESNGKFRSKGLGIIPTLLTLERVSAPDLVRLTDEIKQYGSDDAILLGIDENIFPNQMQFIAECKHMIKIIRKYQGLAKVIKDFRKLRLRQEALRLAIEHGGG